MTCAPRAITRARSSPRTCASTSPSPASKIEPLAGLYESITAVLTTTMTKASFNDPGYELRRHNIQGTMPLPRGSRLPR